MPTSTLALGLLVWLGPGGHGVDTALCRLSNLEFWLHGQGCVLVGARTPEPPCWPMPTSAKLHSPGAQAALNIHPQAPSFSRLQPCPDPRAASASHPQAPHLPQLNPQPQPRPALRPLLSAPMGPPLQDLAHLEPGHILRLACLTQQNVLEVTRAAAGVGLPFKADPCRESASVMLELSVP